MSNSLKGFLLDYREVVELGLVIWFLMSSSVRDVIAMVNEILQSAVAADDSVALNKATQLLKRKFPFLPEILLRAIIQWFFDSMKKKAKKEVAEIKAFTFKA